MTGRPLSRCGDGRPAAPVRLLHLGLGSFFRAHQAWYTEHAPDARDWGYAAFAGRGRELARLLQAQDGLYTLLTRGPEADRAEVIASISRAVPGADHDGWLAGVASPAVGAITITVTEGGYCQAPGGGLDRSRPDVADDVDRLRRDRTAAVTTAPARLVAGLDARRRAGGGPLAVVPCDNLPDNGNRTRRVLIDLAGLVDPDLAGWIEATVAVVTTVVDRITPKAGPADLEAAARVTGRKDAAPVVTEPFSEWILAGEFPAGRPRWEDAGATFTDDVTGYEHRKLWLLNGAHSLLAYAGSALGHDTTPEAIADERLRRWVEDWWTTAAPHLDQPEPDVSAYQAALLRRFSNARLADRLARIAEDGSQKLPIRVLPVLRAERETGRVPAGATRILAAWLCHLRGAGAPVRDVRAAELAGLAAGPVGEAARRVLDSLDPGLGADGAVTTAVADQCRELEAGLG